MEGHLTFSINKILSNTKLIVKAGCGRMRDFGGAFIRGLINLGVCFPGKISQKQLL